MVGRKRFVAALVVSVLASAWMAVVAMPAHATTAGDESQFESLINHERSSRGLNTLPVYGDLVSVARQHSQDMANKGTIWHANDTPYKVSGWTVYGENVGMGDTVPNLHQAFMNSTEHRDNILDREFNQQGVGVVVKDGVIYVTEIFVQRGSSSSSSNSSGGGSSQASGGSSGAPSRSSGSHSGTASSSSANPAPAKPKPKPIPSAPPRTVSLLVQLVGLDSGSVNPATGEALGL